MPGIEKSHHHPYPKDTMTNTTLALSGLTCGGCVKRAQAALAPWADDVTVTLDPPRAVLSGVRGSPAEWQAALSAAGNYTLAPLAAPAAAPPAATTAAALEAAATSWFATYRPLLLILGYLLGGSVLVQVGLGGAVTAHETMRLFMAGFFLVFSFFKMLDLRAFADAYAGYDLLAARWHGWGLLYPFVELALGAAYLANWNPVATNAITLVVMGFSAVGVIRAVRDKRRIRCACLGTVFQLPMSTVTIVEDVGMVLMAAMVLWGLA